MKGEGLVGGDLETERFKCGGVVLEDLSLPLMSEANANKFSANLPCNEV